MIFRIYSLNFTWISLVIFMLLSCTPNRNNSSLTYPITGVAFNHVQVNDGFWLPKIETNRTITIPITQWHSYNFCL